MYLKKKKKSVFYFCSVCLAPPPQSLWWVPEVFTSALHPSCCFSTPGGEGPEVKCSVCGEVSVVWLWVGWLMVGPGPCSGRCGGEGCCPLALCACSWFVVNSLLSATSSKYKKRPDCVWRPRSTSIRMERCGERDNLSVPFFFSWVLNVYMWEGIGGGRFKEGVFEDCIWSLDRSVL